MAGIVSLSRSRVALGSAATAVIVLVASVLAPTASDAAPMLPTASPLGVLAPSLALHYDFADAIGATTVKDVTNNGNDGTIGGTGATLDGTAIDLPGSAYVSIPAEVFESQNSLTISSWLRNDLGSGNYAALFFGKPAAPPSQYWLLNPNNGGKVKSVFTNSVNTGAPWSTEVGVLAGTSTSDRALYTTVITPTSITSYLNGQKLGTAGLTHTVTDFGTDLVAFIGKSSYTDPLWNGVMSDLKVYTAAMTDQQAAAQYYEELGNPGTSQAAVNADAAALSVSTPVASDIVLPTAGSRGSIITWSSSQPGTIAADGTFTAPASSDQTVTLTANLELAGMTSTRDFVVVATSNTSATLLAHYDFSDPISDGLISDVSGHGRDATVVGNGATVNNTDGYLTLPGGASNSGNAYVRMPTGMFDGQNTLTISTWLKNRTGAGDYAAMFFGSNANPPSQYWILNPQNGAGRFKSVVTNGLSTSAPWGTEYGISPTTSAQGIAGPLTDTAWGMYTTVITPNSITGYFNGVKIGTVATTRKVSEFGSNLVGYIGRSAYADKFYAGDVRDVRIYTSAFTAAQVANSYYDSVGDTTAIDAALAADADAVAIDGTSTVSNISLPASGVRGSSFVWTSSNPAVIASNGTVTRPTDTTTTVTLTATLSLGGRTLVQTYDVTVIADTPQANLDYVAAGYELGISVLWQDIALPTTVGAYAVTWVSSSAAAVATDGTVSRTASSQSATLTATFTDGVLTSSRSFPVTVLPQDHGWIGTGIGSGNTDDTDNLRLSSSTDGAAFAALNDGEGVLFPELDTRKMGSPVAFRHPNGGFGLVSTLDSNSNKIYVFDSASLYSFSNERLVQFAPSGMRAARVSVAYDNAIAAYRLHFIDVVTSQPKEVTTKDFVTFTAPVASSAPTFVTGGFPSNQVETDAIAVTQAEYDAVLARLGRVHSTSVGTFANLEVAKGETGTLPVSTTVTYSNGTTTKMPVTWDTSGVNWNVPGTYTVNGTVERPSYASPLVSRRADPDVTVGDDGYYYFTASYPMTSSGDPQGYDRVILRRSATIDGLGSATEVAIWDESSESGMNRYIWAPELEKINGEWYILFTAARNSVFDIRPAMLRYTGGTLSGAAAMDPANWETVGYMLPAAGDSIAFNSFSLDMTHFEHNGTDYAIWAQSDPTGFSTLRMAPMDSANPQQMSGQSIQLSRPTRAWEQASGVQVNEGPAVIMNGGKVIVAFSSASVDAAYNVSAMWADGNADLMDPASWHKLGYPLLTTADVPGQFGPGHNSFTVDALGNPVMVYHSRASGAPSNPGEASDGGLFDPRRNAQAATVHWDVDGLPLLDMTPTEELNPALAPVTMQVKVLPEANLVVQYLLDETSGTVAADSSGNGKDATYVGGPTLKGDAGAVLDGVDDYVKLPNNILAGLDSVTISMDVLVNPSQSGAYFIYGLGNPANSGSGTGYLATLGDGTYRTTITTGNWSGEKNATSTSSLTRGVWKTLTYTLDDASDTARIYLDGVLVKEATGITVKPSQLGMGVTTANAIGKSNYATDNLLKGSVRDFKMYSVALDASAVAALAPADAKRVARDKAALDLGDTSNVTSNLTLPTTGLNGSAIVWSSGTPGNLGDNGSVTRPSYASGDAHVTLTATVTKGAVSETRQFTVIVKAMADDQSIADAGAAALSVTNIGDVRGNLTLPTQINGLPVTWTTSDGSIITTGGIVTRPAGDTDVTLTATVTKGAATAQHVFTAHVKAAFVMGPLAGYGFAYFTGNTIQGEKIYFAASDGNNALKWDELNGGNPVLASTYGEMGLRDPFVIRSPEGDTFYLIATDLSIGRNGDWGRAQTQGSRYLEIWESHDMVNWSAQRHVKVSPDNAGNTWAPEAYFDESIGEYVVFWASKLYANNDPGHTGNVPNSMVYVTTRDFVTFSDIQPWQTGISRIDSTVTEVGGTYYRFTKDEGGGTTGCSDIIQESSPVLTAPLSDWSMTDSCIGRDAGTGAVEGPSIFKSNPGDVNGDYHYLFVDEYGNRGYIPLRTANIANPNWQVAPSYNLPASPRHGTVIPVTAAELAAMRATIVRAPDVVANANGEVLRYDFQTGSGTTLTDVTGNGYHGTIVGGSPLAGGELVFDGSNDYVSLPDNIMAGLEDITIEADVYISSAQSGAYFIYGLGNTTGGAGDGYLATLGNPQYRTALATANWSTEQSLGTGQALARNTWVKLTYTLSGTTARLYLDGVQVATGTVTTNPGDIGDGFTSHNRLGDSNYDGDNFFNGRYREFAIYNRALSPAEVLASVGRTDVLLNISLADDSVLKLDPIIDQDAHTVVFPVEAGTDLTALAPVFTTVAGVTASPASGTLRDLSSGVPVQLAGASTATWTMSAVEMRSPILPGFYADPNVVAYGDTYYIYATTDGTAGWGGKDFYVWSSKDLVNWTRGAAPFLTLDGTSGNVPWASGNAWAPTITEKDGKFYFYFSGHNPALNRKTIGVAVADSPEGPFVAQPTAMILNNEAVTSGQAIDPAAFYDPASGKYFLYWGNGTPVMAELSADMLSLKPGTISAMSGLTGYREGSFMVFRDGLYHLTYSIDDTGSENYRVGYATSTSPTGPWTYRGVILSKDASLGILATGHNSILNVPGTDDWYIVYHRFGMPGGNGTHRETTIDRLTFDPVTGLMQVVTPTLSAVDAQTIVDPEPLTVSITGTAKVGNTLTANVPAPWTAASYQWVKNGVDIVGASNPTLLLIESDSAAVITVKVTAKKPLWSDATRTSASVTVATVVTPEPTTDPSATPGPTTGPTPGPTTGPTPGPTTGPTPGPTTGPTTGPTPGPTPGPTTGPTPGPTPGPVRDAASSSLSVSFHSLRPGESLTVWGSGFEPGEDVVVTLHSTPRQLGVFVANSAGSFTGVVIIPADAALGAHRVEAVGAVSDFRLDADITLVSGSALATTGSDFSGLAGGFLVLLLVGIGAFIVRHRQRTEPLSK